MFSLITEIKSFDKMPYDICLGCKSSLVGTKKKWYCNDICKWKDRFNKTDPNKRNHKFFYLFNGMSLASGQGKRAGFMVKGGMSVGHFPDYSVVKLTKENLELHIKKMNQYGYDNERVRVELGSGKLISVESAYNLIENML